MCWWSQQALGCVLAAIVSRACAADELTNALPSLDTVLKGIVERAAADARVEQAFKARYSFVHARTREEYNTKGSIKKRETQKASHDPSTPQSAPVPSPAKHGRPTEANSSQEGIREAPDEEWLDRPYERKGVPVTERLMRRFQFAILGRDAWEGLPLLKLDFRSAVPNLPAKGLLERFVNRMAGTVWVDERDFTVARLSVHLTEKVNVAGGLLGSVSAFECWFERARTEDGLWYTRRVDWSMERREFLVNKIIRQQETWGEVRKVMEGEEPRGDRPGLLEPPEHH